MGTPAYVEGPVGKPTCGQVSLADILRGTTPLGNLDCKAFELLAPRWLATCQNSRGRPFWAFSKALVFQRKPHGDGQKSDRNV